MAEHSTIEWTDATWNPITGCSVVSPGCTNCYAMRLAGTRLKHHPSRAGLTKASKAGPVWTGETRMNEEWLTQPLTWRRPRMVFVCAHGDLFHESVPDEWIDRVFAVMALCPQHTFQVLTKRAARMRHYLTETRDGEVVPGPALAIIAEARRIRPRDPYCMTDWPLPNVWLGVSVEDQTRADERVPDLLATPAAVRWISAEPLLRPVDLGRWLATAKVECSECAHKFWLHDADPCEHGPIEWTLACPKCGACKCTPKREYRGDVTMWGPPSNWRPRRIGRFGRVHPSIDVKSGLDWVIAGGESGPGARPMHPDWARDLRDQCAAAGVPFFFKQWGEWFPRSQWEFNPDLILPDDECVGWMDTANLINTKNETLHAVGKARAGRLLDGIEHNGMPEALR